MTHEAKPTRLDLVLRIIAATLGTLPVALLTSACIARFAPLSPDLRFAIAYAALVPLWVSAMCVAFLARRGAHALFACALVSALLALCVWGAPHGSP